MPAFPLADFWLSHFSARRLFRFPAYDVIENVWWGLCEADYKKGHLKIVKVRLGLENNNVDPTALVQLLWKDEALEILKERKLHKGLVNKPRRILWQRITECLSLNELREEVRNRIKTRQNWRVASQQVSYDD